MKRKCPDPLPCDTLKTDRPSSLGRQSLARVHGFLPLWTAATSGRWRSNAFVPIVGLQFSLALQSGAGDPEARCASQRGWLRIQAMRERRFFPWTSVSLTPVRLSSSGVWLGSSSPMRALVLQRAVSRKQSHALTLKIGEQAGRREPR